VEGNSPPPNTEENIMVIATFENAEDGVKVYVSTNPKGFAVSVQDTDSGEFLSGVVIYPNEETARQMAAKAAGI
jgi:hypothetical protein